MFLAGLPDLQVANILNHWSPISDPLSVANHTAVQSFEATAYNPLPHLRIRGFVRSKKQTGQRI
jgi:hypothetical protein